MIKRIWHGWTDPGMADTYAHVLTTQVIPGIEAKAIPGYLASRCFVGTWKPRWSSSPS